MQRVQIHLKTDELKDESRPIEERIQDIDGTPHVKVGDSDECKFPNEVKKLFYENDGRAIEIDQTVIDRIIKQEHTCTCDDCQVMRLVKFLTKRRGENAFIRTVR